MTVLLLAGGLGHAMRENWLRHVEAERQRIADVAAVAASTLRRQFEAVERALVDLSVLTVEALADGATILPSQLDRHLQELERANPFVNRFGIRDAAGHILATSDPKMRGAPSVVGRDFFEVHRNGTSTGLYVAPPFDQTGTGVRVVLVSRAARAADGRLLGVVAAMLPTAILLEDVAGLRHVPTQLVVVRDDGIVLQRRGASGGAPDTALPREATELIAGAGPGIREVVATLDGRTGDLAWQALPGFPLRVAASVAREDVAAEFLQDVRLSFIVVGIILALAVTLAVWLMVMMRSHLQRLEAESRSLESRFRDGIESMADGVLLFDAEDRLVTWNRRFVELIPHQSDALYVGVDARTLVASGNAAAHPGADAETLTAIVDARMRARRSLEGTELRSIKGRVIEATDRRTSDGGMISIYRDVTDERRLIEQLSVSEGRFRDFASTSSDWFWETDIEHRLTYVSHGIRALGFTSNAAVGDPFMELGNRVGRPLFGADAAHALAAQLDRGEPFRDLELALNPGDGERILQLAGKPLFDREQRLVGFRGGARDITEMRHINRRLAENEARVRDYAEAGSDWMWETDAHGHFTYVSEGVRRFGTSPAEFETRALDALPWRVADDAPGMASLAAAVANRIAFQDVVLPVTLESGRVRQIAMTAWPLRDASNRFTGYRGIGRDVTESVGQRAEVERALIIEREANAQHRRFISIASHEFRTPLAVIDSATQRLGATLPADLPADVGKRLLRIRGAVARMTQIIDRTLASARLDEGRIEFKPEVFDLAALLRELCERQRSIASDFEILCDVPPVFEIEGDPRLMDQIFTNLLSNAVKYSGAARRVDVVLGSDARDCHVAVHDRGVGIDADEVSGLFQRFFRARSAQGVAGTGIGLNLVRELVRMHGGEVEVTSKRDAGSTFTVHVPRSAAVALIEAAQ